MGPEVVGQWDVTTGRTADGLPVYDAAASAAASPAAVAWVEEAQLRAAN